MAWSELRRVKIKLLRDKPSDHDASITFWVAEKDRVGASDVIKSFLDNCEMRELEIKIDEIHDLETHEVCYLDIAVRGNQAFAAQVLTNYYGPKLEPFMTSPHAQANPQHETADVAK